MTWLILVLLSAFFLAGRTILTKKLLQDNNTLPALFYISLLSTIFILFFYKKIAFFLSFDVFALLLLKSIIIAVAWFFIYEAFKYLPISTVAPLRNLSPIFLVVLGYFFLGETVSPVNYLGLFILMVSAYMLEIKSLKKILDPFKFFKTKYFIYIIISLIGNSISAVLDKIIIKSINQYTLMFYFFLFISIIYFFIIIAKKEFFSVKEFKGKKNITLLLSVSLMAVFADITYFTAVAIPGTLIILIIPIRRLSTFISVFAGGKLFREKNLLYKSAICLIMILAIYLTVL